MSLALRGLSLVLSVTTLLLYLSVLPAVSQPTGCLLPSTEVVTIRLESILLAMGGEGGTQNITLVSHHFSCLAVAESSGRFDSLSVAVTYTSVTTGDQLLRYHFQLECSNGVFRLGRENDNNPPAGAFTESRRDCRVCSGVNGPANLIDTVTNCICKFSTIISH